MEFAMANKAVRSKLERNNELNPKILLFVLIFISALKITVFNMLMIPSFTSQAFLYKFGITFLLASIIYLIVLGTVPRFFFLALYFFQAIYIISNIIYFIYSHSYLHISQAFALFSEGVGAAGDVSTLISPKLFVAVLDLPVVIYAVIVYPKLAAEIKKSNLLIRYAFLLTCLLIIAANEGWNYMHNYSIFNLVKSESSLSETFLVQRYGTVANGIVDMAFNRKDSDLISHLNYGNSQSGKERTDNKPNFVIIQIESMDSNAISKQHNGKLVMPFLNKLAQQNVYYPYTLSYHEAGGTSDCEFSVINSVEPLTDFPSMLINNYTYPNSIIKQLTKDSYSAIAFHGNVGSYFNRDVAYPKMGFQFLADMTKMGLKDVGWGAPDNDVFKYAENRLKDEKQPFLSYSITMSSHGPFTNVNNYYNSSSFSDVKDPLTRDYMNSMSYVDQVVSSYISYISANFKNTYIFIWGDHTPNVNSSDYRQASFTEGDRYFEFVPLIIVTPDKKQYKEDKAAASFLDIAPTIANASGVSYIIASNGLDLFNRKGTDNPIPFKGANFDRNYLFEKISQINAASN